MSVAYRILRGWARLGMSLYTTSVKLEGAPGKASSAPTILACNHPNSFLDAVMMGVFHPRPVYFLARGDAFRKPRAARILRSIGAIPIHRLSEGREHLHLNDATFEECLAILRSGGTVLIFSEGLSQHGTGVRPLGKGTARLAWMAWSEEGLANTVVLPVGLRYSSFTHAPKCVGICYGAPMLRQDGGLPMDSAAHFYGAFNDRLHSRLLESVSKGEHLISQSPRQWRRLLLPLATVGWIVHAPYYLPVKRFVKRKTLDTVFYDSVLFGLLLLTYPLYVVVLTVAAVLLSGSAFGWTVLILLPLSAWATKEWKGAARAEVA